MYVYTFPSFCSKINFNLFFIFDIGSKRRIGIILFQIKFKCGSFASIPIIFTSSRMQPPKANSFSFIDSVVNRLEICFKTIAATFEDYKNSKKEFTIPIPIPILAPPQKKNVQKVPKQRARKQKTVIVDDVDMKKGFSQLTDEEKDELRTKILKQKPKPPMNAFIAYVKAQKDRIKSNSTKNLSIAQITAIASQQWKSLDQQEKMPYISVYHSEHEEYLGKMDKFMKQYPILKKLKMKKSSAKRMIHNKFKLATPPSNQKEKQNSNESQSEQEEVSSSADPSPGSSSEINLQIPKEPILPQLIPKNIVQKAENNKFRQSSSQDRIRIASYEERRQPEAGTKKPILMVNNQRCVKLQEGYPIEVNNEAKSMVNFGMRVQKKQQLKNQAKVKIMGILKAKKAEKILHNTLSSGGDSP